MANDKKNTNYGICQLELDFYCSGMAFKKEDLPEKSDECLDETMAKGKIISLSPYLLESMGREKIYESILNRTME